MKKAFLAILVILSALSIAAAACQLEQQSLAGDMIRLHVIANSDSEHDQYLKLKVRDALLEKVFTEIPPTNADKALEMLSHRLPEARDIAIEVLRSEGCNDEVTVSIERTRFDTRNYDTFSLPAGEYIALRVQLGTALGKNWWCVLFPPLCLGDSSATVAETAQEYGLNQEEMELMLSKKAPVVFRFRILEFIDWIKSQF